MTKKDCEVIARMFAITEPAPSGAWNQWNAMREVMIWLLMKSPRFNEDRFRTTCERAKQ